MFLVIKRNTQHQDNLHELKAAAHILVIKKKQISIPNYQVTTKFFFVFFKQLGTNVGELTITKYTCRFYHL